MPTSVDLVDQWPDRVVVYAGQSTHRRDVARLAVTVAHAACHEHLSRGNEQPTWVEDVAYSGAGSLTNLILNANDWPSFASQ